MRRRSLLGRQTAAPPAGFVADLVSGFIHGYSTARKLRDAYGGAAILLRQQGGSDSADIGFVGGVTDEAAILALSPGDILDLNTKYDQVGSRNFSVAGLGTRPEVRTAAGVITKVSDRVYAPYDGVNDYIFTASATPITDLDCTVFVVFESQSAENIGGVFTEQTPTLNDRNAIYSDTRNTLFRHSNYAPQGTGNLISFPAQQPASTKRCLILTRTGNDVLGYDETGLQIGSTATSADTFSVNTVLELGRQLVGPLYFGGKIAELLINNTALSTTDRNTVLDNITDFYSIV